MLLYPILSLVNYIYSVILSCLCKLFTIQQLPKLFINKYKVLNHILRSLLLITLPFCFSTANSQENPLEISITDDSTTLAADVEAVNLSASDLLKKANSLKRSEWKTKTALANQALRLSINNKNQLVSARANTLLGDLALESNNINQSKAYFLEASNIYKSINDTKNQIISSVDFANVFIAEERYNEAEKILNELLSSAQQFGDDLPIALTLISKGHNYYQQKKYSDAIEQYIESLNCLSGHDKGIQKQRGQIYTKIAESYKRIKNRKQTAFYYKQALDTFTELHDLKYMARTLNTLAQAERYLNNYVIALDYSIQGLEIHKQLDDPEGRAKALMGAGIIYRHIGRYEKSLHHIYEAFLYFKQENDDSGIAKASNQMGFIYTRLKQFDQARSFYQVTLDLPENKIDPNTFASALREIAVIDFNAGHYNSAKNLAEKAYKIYQSEDDKLKSSLTARIIANIYRAENDDTQAIAFYRQSLSLANQVSSKIYQIKAQTPLADLLIGKDTDEAITLLKSSLVLSTEINTKMETLYAYRALRRAEKSRSNFAKALYYSEKEIYLSQVIQNDEENKELIIEKAKLHSHKIEMELEALKEKTQQENKISELELTKNRFATFALASILVICLLVVFFIYRRFIDSRKRNKELDYLAARDHLTNCYNRRVLFEIMNRDFVDIKLLGEYCVIMADIDHFKAVNDTYGHGSGDAVICGIANILQDVVRQNDIVARYGGEEFCIVLPGAAQDTAMRIAENLRKKIETSRFDDITVTSSFGVTSVKFNAKTPIELIGQADLALYESKARGRNQVTLWDPSLE